MAPPTVGSRALGYNGRAAQCRQFCQRTATYFTLTVTRRFVDIPTLDLVLRGGPVLTATAGEHTIDTLTELVLTNLDLQQMEGLADPVFLQFLGLSGNDALSCTVLDNLKAALPDTTIIEPTNCASPATDDFTLTDASHFPGAQLRSCVQTQNGGRYLETLDTIKTLSCTQKGITNAEGIERLTGLTTLDLYDNQLATIDLSALTQLTSLNLGNNPLKDQNNIIGLSSLTALRELRLYDNQLATIDLSALTALTRLNLYGNQLTAVDLTGATQLQWLSLSSNRLTEVDLSILTFLRELYLYDNQLTGITNLAAGISIHINLLGNNDFSCAALDALAARSGVTIISPAHYSNP